MSDNVPFEIQEQIIKRIPVESLLQFRSVCKSWKSLIDSSRFIAGYNGQHHLLVRYEDVNSNPRYVSVVDDDSCFPNQRFFPTHPRMVNIFENYKIIGSSHGLLCFYGYYDGQFMAVVWNLSVIKSVTVVVPNVPDNETYGTVLGFGVCCESLDPKLVKITYVNSEVDVESISNIPSQVEVFTLSTRTWRNPYSGILPCKSIEFGGEQVVVDGSCYWLATDRSILEGEVEVYNLIISFHMTREEFREVKLPAVLVYEGCMHDLSISSLKGSLVVLEHVEDENEFVVWLMEDGGSKSFTRLYTIYTPEATILRVLEFRKSGEPVVEIADHDDGVLGVPPSLIVYDSKSKDFRTFGFNRLGPFYVHSYMETLLLHDQP